MNVRTRATPSLQGTNKETGAKGRAPVIFPRYHQWDAVRTLTRAAREFGPGHDHLVEHSAGSIKSNTVSWLAHQLTSLHGDDDTKVYDKVVVITGRRVLDKQLQETIYQFERVHGVVRRIDKDSNQLAEALQGEQAKIIVTTLQKFPYVTEKIDALPDRTYAVIVDEAHSSQTGDSADELKRVLGGGGKDDDDEGVADPAEDALVARVRARGPQANLSFFAFTATPKARTLELFGPYNPATGKHEATHLYSMRQAIEEGFILDVLAHYVTYQTYWNIEQATPDDPEYDPRKAKAAIARFVSLQESNLAQKAEIIVEHYRENVRRKLGGQTKAMVVSSSRERAARYQQALKKYIQAKGYDLGVLVAFSGQLDLDGTGDPFTEASMNGFPESETTARFDTDEFHILVVAEKYQTGFDQPKLHTMYVDKPLTGLAAVQTLSRPNRTFHHGNVRKRDTFVLDFRNEADAIRKAFEGSVALDETDGEVSSLPGGIGRQHEPEKEPLSTIVELLNRRYGTDFAPEDRVFYDAIAEKLVKRHDIQQAAAASSAENFMLTLDKELLNAVLDQQDTAEAMAFAYASNEDLQQDVLSHLAPYIQGRAKVLNQEHCDIGELLGPDRESSELEYKATLRTHQEGGGTFKVLETASLKTVAAFLNARHGGTLLIGVADDGTVDGLDSDNASLTKKGKQTQDPRDVFQLHLAHIIAAAMGEAAATQVRTQMHHVDGRDICRVQVDPSSFPVDAKVLYQKPDKPKEVRTEFFVRILNGTKALTAKERDKYISGRWPGFPSSPGSG